MGSFSRPRKFMEIFLLSRNYRWMEGAWKFHNSKEYQIYCLFYCFGSRLEFKPCCQIWQKIQMEKSKLGARAFFYQVNTTAIKPCFFLSKQQHCFLYSKTKWSNDNIISTVSNKQIAYQKRVILHLKLPYDSKAIIISSDN